MTINIIEFDPHTASDDLWETFNPKKSGSRGLDGDKILI
jgi:hypothetical protein